MYSMKSFLLVSVALSVLLSTHLTASLPHRHPRVPEIDEKDLNCSNDVDEGSHCCSFSVTSVAGRKCGLLDKSIPGVRVEGNKIVMCRKKPELILVGQPKMKKICYSCEDLKECVLVYTRGQTHHITKRASMEDIPHPGHPGQSYETSGGSYTAGFAVAMVTMMILVFLVMLCAGGGEKEYQVQSIPGQSEAANVSDRNPKSVEVQEVQLDLPDPQQGPPQPMLGDPQVNQPQIVVQQPANGRVEQLVEGAVEQPVGVPVEHPGGRPDRQQEEELVEDDEEPGYDRVQRLDGDHGNQQPPRNRVGVAEEDENGVKISYGRVSRHPGQPPYASVSDVLPQQQDQSVAGEEEGYDRVVLESNVKKDDYAEVRVSTTSDHTSDTPGQKEAGYDVVGSVQVSVVSASQEDQYDMVREPGVSTASQEDQYEVVRDSIRNQSLDVSPPELPPMRTRQLSSSEDDPSTHSGDHSVGTAGPKEGKKGHKDEKKGKHLRDTKDKGTKGLSGIFRHRSATVGNPGKNKGSEVEEGPPLPPNHPQPVRSATGGLPPNRPTPPLPNDVEDFYDEPFDCAPAGRPRKISSSTSKDVTNKGTSLPRGMVVSTSLSPSSKMFPQTPLPEIPPAEEEVDPNYESVTPSLKKEVAEASGRQEEEETPYDTVARIPGTSLPISTGLIPTEEEGETPYDVVTRVPGAGVGVSVSSLDRAVQQQQTENEEEETPYDTVQNIPGTSLPISTRVLPVATKKAESEDPYSTVKNDTSSDLHPYASVDKSKKTKTSTDDVYSVPIDSISTDHDELGYAVVSEEFKRARTMSKEAGAMKKPANKKVSQQNEDPYSTVDSLAIGSSEGPTLPALTPSPPPPISPIKDDIIIQEFCPPPTPPPISISPEGDTSLTATGGSRGDVTHVHKLTVGNSNGNLSPEAELSPNVNQSIESESNTDTNGGKSRDLTGSITSK